MSPRKKSSLFERLSDKAITWIGTPQSILVHTLFFVGIFLLQLFNVSLGNILLILTTVVSLEAIYLAIFIQMTVNRNTQSLEEVEDDIEEIQEDFEEIQEDVEDLTEDIDKIQAEKKVDAITTIESRLQTLLNDIETLKKQLGPN